VRSQLNDDTARVKLFKQNSKRLGNGGIPPADFVQYVHSTFGAAVTKRLVPEMAKLLHDAGKVPFFL
jgi:hypothetical protein